MSNTFKASRDVIIRTEKWSEALKFYGSVLGLPITERSETIMGFETGAFCLYVERGKEHGPIFDFLVPDIQEAKRQLACGLRPIPRAHARARHLRAQTFTVVFYGSTVFCCKTAQLSETPRKSVWSALPLKNTLRNVVKNYAKTLF
jgi:hypothetical protein